MQCSKFQIPASNTVRGVVETQTVLQYDMVKNMYGIQEFCFPYTHVQCMSELCCKFQIPAPNTVGEDAETKKVLGVIWSKVCMSFKGT